MFRPLRAAALLLLFSPQISGWCASGTDGANFLEIPVGGAPAALGSAYTAQANDVYAPIWNPGGLGFLQTTEFTGTHLSYIGPLYYEHAGAVVPFEKDEDSDSYKSGLGFGIQYLGTREIDSRDENGMYTGNFKASFAAYSLSYGRRITDSLSMGAAWKYIAEKISDAKATSHAADIGLMCKPASKLRLGVSVVNLGPGIRFVEQKDPLPMGSRFGATYQLHPQWDVSAEMVYRKAGPFSGSFGAEWRYGEVFSFRGGYNTSHTKELGFVAGITAGVGIFFWGQEFSYAWLPIGDLGTTHYFSLVFRWSTEDRADHPRLKSAEDREFKEFKTNDPSQYHEIFDILNDNERQSVN